MAAWKHLSKSKRIKLEYMYNRQKLPVRKIAEELGVSRSTVYRELKRGLCEQIDTHLCSYTVYSHQIAQKDYAEKQTYKGAPLKIGHDHELARYIEDKIANEHYSPAAVLGEIKALGLRK